MNNFWTRLITGAVFVAVMVGCIWWSFWSMAVLFLVISVLGLREFYTLQEKLYLQMHKIQGMLIASAFYVTWTYFLYSYMALGNMGAKTRLAGVLFIMLLLCSAIFLLMNRNRILDKENRQWLVLSFTMGGIAYTFFPFQMLQLIAFQTEVDTNDITTYFYSPYKVLGFFFLIWSNDTFAYLVGIAMGRTKLYESISPNKTWEGAIGGAICTLGIACLLSLCFPALALIHWLILALITSVFGTLGDLGESRLKRILDVKDSGNIFPGHGGILDRFDGVLLSAPFVVFYLMLIR